MYGKVADRLDLAGTTLFETVHREPVLEPTDEHPSPYIAVLLSGSYREVYRHGELGIERNILKGYGAYSHILRIQRLRDSRISDHPYSE